MNREPLAYPRLIDAAQVVASFIERNLIVAVDAR